MVEGDITACFDTIDHPALLDLLGGDDASAYGPGTAMAWIGLLYALLIIAYNRWRLQGRTGQSWGKRVLNLKLVRMADITAAGKWCDHEAAAYRVVG